MQTVAVIDYGMGNLHSVAKALEHVGAGKVLITSDADVIREADRVVFPGVGAIRDCMAEIRRLGFDSLVREVSQDRPFLGICVGMQALLDSSEENDGVDCIGLFPGAVKFFGKDLHEDGEHLKVPHMGWNEVQAEGQSPAVARHSGHGAFLLRAQLLHRCRQCAAGGGWRSLRCRFRRRAGRWFAFRRAVPPGEKPYPWPAIAAELRRVGRSLVNGSQEAKPPILTLTPEQENEANHKIKRFMEDRFELDLGSFEAAEILELFTREIAPHYYNRAIFDVQTHLKERFESIESDLWALEKN